jgi:hypothetical protein
MPREARNRLAGVHVAGRNHRENPRAYDVPATLMPRGMSAGLVHADDIGLMSVAREVLVLELRPKASYALAALRTPNRSDIRQERLTRQEPSTPYRHGRSR